MQTTLIAGCGYVGEALGRILIEEGRPTWGLRRNPTGLPAGVLPLALDLADRPSLAALPRDVDTVVYAVSADHSSEEAYRVAYVTSLTNLLDEFGSRGQPISRLIFISSTAVYAQDQGEWVDETSATAPSHFSGKILLEAERVALESVYPASVVRLGGIYGPGRTSLIDKVASGEARGSSSPVFTNRIHRDDCARVIWHTLGLQQPASIYVAVDHEPADQRDVMNWIAARMGVALPRAENESVGESRKVRSNKRCSNQLLLNSGYSFLYPTFREGYESLIRLRTASAQ